METTRKYALVTGGTKGIGFEIAKLLAQHHYNLILVARTETDLELAAANLRQYKVDVITMAKDLFDYPSAWEVFTELKNLYISPEILVNDAGQGLYGRFWETDILREIDLVHLNSVSLMILTKLFIKDRLPYQSGKF